MSEAAVRPFAARTLSSRSPQCKANIPSSAAARKRNSCRRWRNWVSASLHSARWAQGFDPKLAELTDDVLYGDIWERPQLSKRDRSLVTVAALIALNRPEQLRSHLIMARKNVNAVSVAKEVFDKK
jgi:alkylhydroperoxidase/carboxymuconolactone decarboxylase family protein YurZ